MPSGTEYLDAQTDIFKFKVLLLGLLGLGGGGTGRVRQCGHLS